MSYKIWIQPARPRPNNDAHTALGVRSVSAVCARKGEEPSAFLLAGWPTYQE